MKKLVNSVNAKTTKAKVMPTLSEVQLSWLAGFIDGEGWIGINATRGKSTLYYYVVVDIVNTDEPTMQYVASLVNKPVYRRNRVNPNWKDALAVRLTSGDAVNLLLRLLPYLVLKRRHAEIACCAHAYYTSHRGIRKAYNGHPALTYEQQQAMKMAREEIQEMTAHRVGNVQRSSRKGVGKKPKRQPPPQEVKI